MLFAVRFFSPVLASESLTSTAPWNLTSESEKVIIGCEAKTVNGTSLRSNATVNILRGGGPGGTVNLMNTILNMRCNL